MTNTFIPIAVQAANKGVPVPVGKTAAEVRAMGFLIDQDTISDSVLELDDGVDTNEIYVGHSGGLTGFHWRRHRRWENDCSARGVIRMWCGGVCAKMYPIEDTKDTRGWRVGSHVEAVGWVKNRVAEDLSIAQQEIDVMTTIFNSPIAETYDPIKGSSQKWWFRVHSLGWIEVLAV